MELIMKKKILIIVSLLIAANISWAQTAEQIQKYLKEPLGDKTYRKKGVF